MNPGIWASATGKPENSALLNQFLNGTPDNRAGSFQAPENGWSKPFNLPASQPKPTPEQQAAVEQFQQLLQPHLPPASIAKAPTFGSPFFSTASASEPATVIPVGASFAPLGSGIAQPAGLTPLPGILGPTNVVPAEFAPEWKPQSPPWESSAPQLGAIPQRKF